MLILYGLLRAAVGYVAGEDANTWMAVALSWVIIGSLWWITDAVKSRWQIVRRQPEGDPL